MKINNLVAELAKQNLTNDEILWYKFCENFNLDCNLIENNFYRLFKDCVGLRDAS
jgi:hypothetical protein